jgi:hydrogenase maturation factor
MSITDYTITTYQDALVRAENELISNNSVAAQNNPNNPMNVGSEMFDVITLINTGNNSTSVNGNYRVFNQTFTLDGSKGQYSIQIETGDLST